MPYSVWNTMPSRATTGFRSPHLPDGSPPPGTTFPAIVAHAVRHYTRPGELVLDPRCASGAALAEAVRLGRGAIGMARSRPQAEAAQTNLRRAAGPARARRDAVVVSGHDVDRLERVLSERVALIVIAMPHHPPPAGRGDPTGPVSGPPSHLGQLVRAGADRELFTFSRLLRRMRPLLRPGGTLLVTLRPWHAYGELVDLPGAVWTLGRRAGLPLSERCAALLVPVGDGELLLPAFPARRRDRCLVVHEDVLVFREPGGEPGGREKGGSPPTRGEPRPMSSWPPAGQSL
ncbi:hypothetical protein RM844_13180 [Streptomyces sp. DSM 44915]|uniref:Methyltransferase n=1 Tax=Streptomyces chisholmiae TaxID=3075540 RepID=A0ABU2JR51_9ACTN|nr:hypothetical protein [Streptomyces sp. DSM 44915]MDT0267238.1 hypothetical protein [Streptomyces sp. DSM 44915]